MHALDAVQRYPLFALAANPARAWLAAGQTVGFSTGETVFQEGSPGEWAYLLIKGRVRVIRRLASGRDTTLGSIAAGELFGEYALLSPGRNTATCRAAEDCVALQFPLGPVRAWLANSPAVSSRLKNWLQLHYLLRQLRGQAFLGFMSAPSALAMQPHLDAMTVPPMRAVQADGLCDDRWFYVEEGEVLVSPPDEPARTLTAGTSFGEHALAGADPPPAVALMPTRVLALPRDFFVRPDRPAGSATEQSYAAAILEAPSRVKWLPQKEASDCGPTCLAMIAHYFQLKATPEEIRVRVAVGPGGATLAELLRAAAALGLHGSAVRVGPAQLRHVHVPAIVHLKRNHYVVLFRFDADGALLGDPAAGLVTVSLIHFVQMVAGGVLPLRPVARPT